MPAPIGKYATDRLVYGVVDKISPHICFVNPNIVTIVNYFVTLYIIHCLYKDKSTKHLLALVCVHMLLDCLDGSIARNCNSSSYLGGMLDITGDMFMHVSLLLYALHKITSNDSFTVKQKNIVIMICLFIIVKLGFIWNRWRQNLRVKYKGAKGKHSSPYGTDIVSRYVTGFIDDNAVLLAGGLVMACKHIDKIAKFMFNLF